MAATPGKETPLPTDLKAVVEKCADPEDVDETIAALDKAKAKKLADFSAMTTKDLEDTIDKIPPAIKSKLRDALSPFIKQASASLRNPQYPTVTGTALSPKEQPTFISPYPHPTMSFVSIRVNGIWFADRTNYLNKLELDSFPNFAIMRRPPRMGKSFMLRMLDVYYDIDCPPDVFAFCFNNLVIKGKQPKRKHMIMTMDFSCLKDGPFTTSNIEYAVKVGLQSFVTRYANRLKATTNLFSLDTRKSLRNILNQVGTVGETVFLLIDEIDAGASWVISALLADRPTETSIMQASTVFGLVKEQQYSNILVRGFASGITTLHIQEVLTMSVWRDISLEEQYHAMYGLRDYEIRNLVERFAADRTAEQAVFMTFLRDTQDGYRFTTCQQQSSVYNTTLALKITTAFITQEVSWQMTDTTDIVPVAILCLMGKLPTLATLAQSILDNKIVRTDEIHAIRELGKYIENITALQDNVACLRFLFSIGFLTIRLQDSGEDLRVHLQVPNTDVSNLIQNAITQYKYRAIENSLDKFRAATTGLCTGQLEVFITFLESTVLASLDPYDDAGTVEQAWKLCVLPHITWFNAYHVKSEAHTPSGRLDIWAELLFSAREQLELKDLVIELKHVPLLGLQFPNGRHPTTHELSNRTDKALRKTLFVGQTPMVTFEKDAMDQCTKYAHRMATHSTQPYCLLRITLLFLGTVRILGNCNLNLSSHLSTMFSDKQ